MALFVFTISGLALAAAVTWVRVNADRRRQVA